VACFFVLLVDEGCKGVDILLQYLLQRFLGALSLVVEGVADGVQVNFRLPHDRPGNSGQDVLQVFGGADTAQWPRRIADDADRLAEERALAIGARSDVDGVLQHPRDRTIVFRRDEQHAIRFLQLVAEREPVGRRICFQILIEKRDVVQGDDIQLERIRRQFRQRIGDLEAETLFAKAADNDDNAVRGGHGLSFF
jgi:hypothetical protein